MKFKVVSKNLNEELLFEMARIGFTEDGYEVYIRTDDSGNIPHFHYWDRTTKGGKFHTCIRIDCAKYFHHTGKESVLNHDQKKSLVKFLKSPYRNLGITQWQRLLMDWNDNNEHIKVDETLDMPDYTQL